MEVVRVMGRAAEPDELFRKFVECVRRDISCNMLGKKLKTWHEENKGDFRKTFGFRFRGQESRAYLTHFPRLISLVLPHAKGNSVKLLLRLHLQSILLRQIVCRFLYE